MVYIIAILIVFLIIFGWLVYDSMKEYEELTSNRGYGDVGRTEMKETSLTDSINVPRTIRVGHEAVAREYIPYTPIYKKSICSECDRAVCEMCELYDKVMKPGSCRMCGRCSEDPPCPYCNSDRKFEAFTHDPTPGAGYLKNIDTSENYFKR